MCGIFIGVFIIIVIQNITTLCKESKALCNLIVGINAQSEYRGTFNGITIKYRDHEEAGHKQYPGNNSGNPDLIPSTSVSRRDIDPPSSILNNFEKLYVTLSPAIWLGRLATLVPGFKPCIRGNK